MLVIDKQIDLKVTDKARKYMLARGKGACALSINTHIHQGAGTVKINLTADAQLGVPTDNLEDYEVVENGDVKLYVHESVKRFADSDEGVIAFESGFLFTGLVFKNILKVTKR